MKKCKQIRKSVPSDRIYKLSRQMQEIDSKKKSGDPVQIPLKGGLGAQIHFSHWGLGQQPTMRHREGERWPRSRYKTRNTSILKTHSQGPGAPWNIEWAPLSVRKSKEGRGRGDRQTETWLRNRGALDFPILVRDLWDLLWAP